MGMGYGDGVGRWGIGMGYEDGDGYGDRARDGDVIDIETESVLWG